MPLGNPQPPGLRTIETRGHTTPEGLLNLSVPVGLADVDVSVILQVKPLPPATEVDESDWPLGYFDALRDSIPDLERGPQGEFEQRPPLG